MNYTLEIDTRTAYRMARTVGYLRAAPALVVWMLDQAVPSMQTIESDGSQKLKASFGRLPLKEDAVDGSDEIYSILVDAAADFAKQLRQDPPIAALPVVARDVNSSGIPGLYRRTPRHVWLLTTEVAVWLTDRVDQWAGLPGGEDTIDHLHARFRFWDAVYPQAPRVERLYSRRTCDVCGYRAVEASETDDGAVALACSRCGQVYEGDLQAAFMKQLEAAA